MAGTDLTRVNPPRALANRFDLFTLIHEIEPPAKPAEGDFAPAPAEPRRAVLNLMSGELVPLDDIEALKLWRVQLREVEHAIAAARRVADRYLLAEMSKRARWTLPVADRREKLTASSSAKQVIYEPARAVYETLLELAEKGVVAAELPAEVVEVVPVSYKVRANPLKQALKVPEIEKALAPLRKELPPGDRTISVKG